MSIPRLETIGYRRAEGTRWPPARLAGLLDRVDRLEAPSPPELTARIGGADELGTPPQPGELAAALRIRRLVEPEVTAKACPLLAPAELDRLAAELRRFGPGMDVAELRHELRGWYSELLAPALTGWDLRVLRPLWADCDRWLRAWSHRLPGFQAAPLGDLAVARDLLASFRARDAEHARAISQGFLDHEVDRLRRLFGPDAFAP